MVSEITFLSLTNINVKFAEPKKLTWRSYDTVETLATTSRVELIDKSKFAKIALDKNFETFVMNVIAFKMLTIMPI